MHLAGLVLCARLPCDLERRLCICLRPFLGENFSHQTLAQEDMVSVGILSPISVADICFLPCTNLVFDLPFLSSREGFLGAFVTTVVFG